MRKIRADRSIKKVRNNLDDFYVYWARYPIIAEKLKGLSNKESITVSENLKVLIDRLYYSLRVEEKYMYHSNLYEVYEALCIYFMKKNKVLENLEKVTGKKWVSDKVKDKEDLDVIQRYIGYETAFNKHINEKADDTLHWLYSCLDKIIKFYLGKIKNDNVRALSAEVKNKVKNFEEPYFRKEIEIQNEIDYINNILKGIKYARENIDVIYTLGYEKEDKKLRTMIKSSLTRAEKLMKLVIDEIEEPYAA